MTSIVKAPLGLLRGLRTRTLLINSCAVRAIATIDNPDQGEQRAWPAVTQTINCARLSKAAAIRAGLYTDETSGAIGDVITMPWDAVIHAGDKIEMDGDGVQWSVEGDITPVGTHDVGIFLQVVKVPL